MILLAVSLLILPLAPLLYALVARRPGFMKTAGRLLTLIMAVLVAAYMIPASIKLSGILWTVIMMAIGLFLPTLGERALSELADTVHKVPLFIGTLGLAIHATMDGAALALPSNGAGPFSVYSMAVVLHKLPAALFIWAALFPNYGRKIPILALVLEGVCTVVGFYLGETLFSSIEALSLLGLFQALVAGSMLHVALEPRVFSHGHTHAHGAHRH